MKIVDYSWDRPTPTELVEAGYAGVMRYLGPDIEGRDLGERELEALWDAGLGVGLIWETSANRALGGWEAGCYDAGQADYYAALLRAPDSVPIYFASDCDVNPAETWGPVMDYFAGASGSAHPVRAYGEADVLDMCAQTLGMRHGWQAAATAWSGGRISANASMLQEVGYYVDGASVDHNDVTCPNDQVDWLWGGDDMALSQDDLNRIQQVVNDSINGALAKMYTGGRALKVAGKPEIWTLVTSQGVLCRRYLGSHEEIGMLQWVDWLAGPKGDPARELTDQTDIAAFEALPTVGYPGTRADAGEFEGAGS